MNEQSNEKRQPVAEVACGRCKELEAVNERDRTTVAFVWSAVLAVVRGYGWATEGRGPYHYDDDRYRQEFGCCLDGIERALAPLEAIVKDLTDCPATHEAAVQARQPLISRREFRALLDLVTAWDGWPIEAGLENTIEGMLTRLAGFYGYDNWVEAHHGMSKDG